MFLRIALITSNLQNKYPIYLIPIIAILAALLLPALAKARDKAMLTSCKGRQKEVNRIIQFYNMDYDGWFCVLAGRLTKTGNALTSSSKPYFQLADLYLSNVRNTTNIFYCPSDSVPGKRYTIVMNAGLGYMAVYKMMNIKEIKIPPAKAIMTAECDHDTIQRHANGIIYICPDNSGGDDIYFGRHGKTSAFSFLDGRVISIKYPGTKENAQNAVKKEAERFSIYF